jgi:hypothetical protein
MQGQEAHGWYAATTGGDLWSSNPVTVQVKNRDVFAEVALTSRYTWDGESNGLIGIVQVVSDSGVENWGIGGCRQAVFRKNVTSVTVQFQVKQGGARGRLFINDWG